MYSQFFRFALLSGSFVSSAFDMAALATGAGSFKEQVAANKPTPEQDAVFAAWYDFTHPHGTVPICLRPGGVMYAPGFLESGSRWYVASPDGTSIAPPDNHRCPPPRRHALDGHAKIVRQRRSICLSK